MLNIRLKGHFNDTKIMNCQDLQGSKWKTGWLSLRGKKLVLRAFDLCTLITINLTAYLETNYTTIFIEVTLT